MMLALGIVIGLLIAIVCRLIIRSQAVSVAANYYDKLTTQQGSVVQTKDTLTEVLEAEKV